MGDKHHYEIVREHPLKDFVLSRCSGCGLMILVHRATLRLILLGIRRASVDRYLKVVVFE